MSGKNKASICQKFAVFLFNFLFFTNTGDLCVCERACRNIVFVYVFVCVLLRVAGRYERDAESERRG